VYAASQVARLRQIRQLLDAGMRPGKVVGLGAEALARLLAETSVNDLSDLSRTKMLSHRPPSPYPTSWT
jgi:hypothetical protein